MSESTILTADSYKNVEQQEVVDSPDESKDENLEKDLQEDKKESQDADVSESKPEEGAEETKSQESDSEEADAEAASDDSHEEEGEQEKSEKPEIPKWAEKRLLRERRKHEREMSELKKQVQDFVVNVQQQPAQGIDSNTQVQNPFTGQIVDKNSVEGQVALQLTQAAQLQEQAEKQQKINEAQAELKRKLEKGYDKFEDYESVITGAGITQTMLEAAYLSDDTDELIYNLAKYKPDEIEKISKLSPERQFREMVLLEQQMKQSTKKKIVKKVPEPPSKIKGSGASIKDESDLSFEDVLKRRRQNERKALGLP